MEAASYDSYRESGIKWLTSIPSHWEIRKLKFMASIQNGSDYKHIEVQDNEDGYPVYGSGGAFRKTSEYLYDGSSVLFGRKGTIDKPLLVHGKFWTVDTMFYSEIEKSTDERFMFYSALTIQYQMLATQTALPSITQSDLSNYLLAYPEKNEQISIVKFLDYKTTQIDRLISKKKMLIEKLNEQRIAVITQAVTKGLNPYAPMKDSEVDWLGEVPEHWEVKAFKFSFNFLNNRRVPLSTEERAVMPKNYRYYGASGVIDMVESYIFDEPTVLIGEDGANLLSRSTPLAFEVKGKYWVNNHAHILLPVEEPFSYWSNLLCIVQYDPWITGSAQPKLTKDNLGTILLPRPPVAEQFKIAEFIANTVSKVDPMIDLTKRTISKLEEYRTALITAAVTGKIDVRGFDINKNKTKAITKKRKPSDAS